MTIGASSCQVNEGIAEPDTYICTIIDDKVMECVHTYDPNTRKDISIIDGIGYQCISSSGYGKIKTHHDVLHDEITRLRKK